MPLVFVLPFTALPTIVLSLRNISVEIRSDFTIFPIIDLGLPEATVTWSHNGEHLDPGDPRVTISNGSVLTVTGAKASDRGVYTITAYNIAKPHGVMASVDIFINC